MAEERLTFLSTVPIFSFLNRTELETMHDLFAEEVFQKGDTVCRSGDPGDKFYVVLSGELEVWGGKGDVLTGTLGERDFFGEMALLQGGKRTATVTVSRRARLLSMEKAAFERVFLTNPKALEYFARVLSKRLASVTRGDSAVKSTMVVGVGGPPGVKGKTILASATAGILKELTGSEVLLVRIRPGKSGLRSEIAQLLAHDLGDAPTEIQKDLKVEEPGYSVLLIEAMLDKPKAYYGERASNLVQQLSRFFPYIVFDLGSGPQELLDSAGQFSDVFLELVENVDQPAVAPADSMKVYRVLNLHNRNTRRVCISDCEPFVLPDEPALGDGAALYAYLHKNPTSPVSLTLYRLGRKLLGATVGLALGGGAAFGIAHIGVLKVLEENGIPIDIVAGCSQGSIIGVGYASGIPTEELVSLALRLGRKRNTFLPLDFTMTRPGILAGNKMIKIFSPLLKGKTTFEDLVIPCRTIATDIETGERVSIGSGQLSAAFRSSSSVPMIFAPYKIGERVLVDGGVADPVPAEVVRQMGADICIAVNVVPPLKKGVETVISRTFRQLNALNPLSYMADSQGLPNLLDIVMNSMQILQYELGNFKAISADVLVNPDLSDFTWIEYYRAEALIQRGVEATERVIPAIKKVIEEKLAPARKRRAEATLMAQSA